MGAVMKSGVFHREQQAQRQAGPQQLSDTCGAAPDQSDIACGRCGPVRHKASCSNVGPRMSPGGRANAAGSRDTRAAQARSETEDAWALSSSSASAATPDRAVERATSSFYKPAYEPGMGIARRQTGRRDQQPLAAAGEQRKWPVTLIPRRDSWASRAVRPPVRRSG